MIWFKMALIISVNFFFFFAVFVNVKRLEFFSKFYFSLLTTTRSNLITVINSIDLKRILVFSHFAFHLLQPKQTRSTKNTNTPNSYPERKVKRVGEHRSSLYPVFQVQ